MKKYFPVIICIIIGLVLFPLCMGFNKQNYPNEYYNVYLDEELLGTIKSEEALLEHISQNTKNLINIENITKTYCENKKTLDEIIKENNLQEIIDNNDQVTYYKKDGKNCVDITLTSGTEIEKIYTPLGLKIEKTLTYRNDIQSTEDVYSKIVNKKSFTVKGYQFTITDDDKESYIYVTDKNIFEEAVRNFISVYVGEDEYKSYINDSQDEIKTVGSILENIYIQETIKVKEKQIPIDNKIFTDSSELQEFLLYGDSPVTQTYKVKSGEMISDIALANEISNEEFLISNPKYKSVNSLIAVGSTVNIKRTNPQLKVVIEKYVVEDKDVSYKTIYEYDDTQYVGYEKTKQEGVNGLQRVKQKEKIVNGNIVYVEPKGKESLKDSVDRIIVKGEKIRPNVGDLNNWAWPSESGWTTTSGYSWRIHPITGKRSFHYGLDIAGTGYNSAIYAANNGTVISKVSMHWSFGNYIVIDHNNGYYTLYAHMNKFVSNIKIGDTVLRGQQIGYVGSTGESTGPHIHFELWKGCLFCRINPWSIYR